MKTLINKLAQNMPIIVIALFFNLLCVVVNQSGLNLVISIFTAVMCSLINYAAVYCIKTTQVGVQ